MTTSPTTTFQLDYQPPPSPEDEFTKSFNNSVKSSTIISIVTVIGVVLLVIISIIYKMRHEPQRKQEGTASPLASSPVNIKRQGDVEQNQVLQMAPLRTTIPHYKTQINGIGESERIVDIDSGLSSNQELPLVPTHIYSNLTLNQIAYIKTCCRESLKVGEGSFARVYRGVFQGKDLAIKEIEHRSPDTKTWVENEVELLQGKEHKNINKLFAWFIEANISYLAYMYIDGCSLDDYLRGNCKGFAYSWKQSLRMIIGIAKGIEFLHMNKIIHVDIKPQNIMVDVKDNEAKLVDFGFSRHMDWEGTHRSTDKIIGTKGYWAPEYCCNNKLSDKHDVYSFGIVVLEMITGQRHVDQARGSSQFHIPGYVRHMIENHRFEEAVDSKLIQEGWDIFGVEEAFAVANIALRCAHPNKAERPKIGLVVTQLSLMENSAQNHISPGQEEEEIAIVTSQR